MSLRFRYVFLVVAALAFAGCGNSDDSDDAAPVSAATHPFELQDLDVKAADGTTLGRVTALVVDDDQDLLVKIDGADGKAWVATPDQMMIAGDHAMLAKGVTLDSLLAYDPARHHPFGSRVEP